MQTLSGPSADQPLATNAMVVSTGAAGRLILKPAATTPAQSAPPTLMPPWELRGTVIDRLA